MKLVKLLFIVTLFFTVSANAQITRGNWIVGRSDPFTSSKTTSTYGFDESTAAYHSNTLQLIPNMGYFSADKFALGAILILAVMALQIRI